MRSFDRLVNHSANRLPGKLMNKEYEIKDEEFYLSIVGASPILKVLGGIFALPGIIAWLVGLGSGLFSQEAMSAGDIFGLFFTGGMFVLLGSALGSLNMWASINSNGSSLRKGTKILGFSSSSAARLSPILRLELTKEWRSSSSNNGGSYLVYPLKLITKTKTHDLTDSTEFSIARGQAEALARFLNISLEDATSGQGFERQPSELDNKLVDDIIETIEAPSLPENSNVSVTRGEDEIILTLPARKGVVASGMFKLIILIPAFIFFSQFLDKFSLADNSWAVQTIVIGVFSAILLFHSIKHLSPLFSAPRLILNPEKILYREVWYKKSQQMKCADIEEIHGSEKNIVQLVTDKSRIELKLYRSEVDRDFVRDMLMYCLQFTKKPDVEK